VFVDNFAAPSLKLFAVTRSIGALAARPFACGQTAHKFPHFALRSLGSPAHILHCANARTLALCGASILPGLLQRQLLLFSQKPHSSEPERHKVKVLYQVNGAVRGCAMKRRTARQLVRLLSDIRHSAHCSTLRAAATNRAMELAAAEEDEPQTPESPEDTREPLQDERIWRGS
jgi:hypothetical protein